MRVLIACEFSQIVARAFRERGHEAYSCDILPTEGNSEWHIQGDVRGVLGDGWDMMIAHPPCTFLANSGVQHLYKQPERWESLIEANKFFLILLNTPIEKIAVENPVPHGYTILPAYSQIIHPYQFGHEVQKRTCLWLKNLPLLKPTNVVSKGERYIGKNGKSNGSRWYQILSMNGDRWKERSRTFEGVARAMAEQWGEL